MATAMYKSVTNGKYSGAKVEEKKKLSTLRYWKDKIDYYCIFVDLSSFLMK